MTDEQASNAPANDNQGDGKPVNTEIDPILRFLARVVRDSNLEIGISLNLKGTIVTGIAISSEKYFDGLAKEFGKRKDSEIMQTFAEAFEAFRDNVVSERLKQENEANDAENEANDAEPVYINLKNAKFASGTIFAPNETGIYWRGRLDQVDGFFIGNF